MRGDFFIEMMIGLLFSFQFINAQPLAEGQDKFLGCAWSSPQSLNFVTYWNQVTPENASKWGAVEYTRDNMNWAPLNEAYAVARNNNYPFKLHTLIWGNQQPTWIEDLDTSEQRLEIEEWFSSLAAKYTQIEFIDVVNEPLHAPPVGTGKGNYMNALGGNGVTGWDWVIKSFRMARKYFPSSQLLINEYSVTNSLTSTKNYLTIIKLLQKENLIDGIGIQAHAFSTSGVPVSTINECLDSLANTGLPIYISELDINGSTDISQINEYRRVFPVFWNHTAVKGITMWGFRYGMWRTPEGAYLVTNSGIERPAFTWLKAFVNDTLVLAETVNVSGLNNQDTVYVDDSLQMVAEILPQRTTLNTISWTVGPISLARIDEKGILSPLATGKVVVRGSCVDGSGKSGIKEIMIIKRPVDSIAISVQNKPEIVTLHDTLQLNATVFPANATNKSFTWSVFPSDIAEINQDGLLTPQAKGSVTVIATSDDNAEIADTIVINIENLPTYISGTISKENIKVYPNPVTSELYLSGIEQIKTIVLFDLAGKQWLIKENRSEAFMHIPLNIQPGVYIIRLFGERTAEARKVIVEKE